MKSRYTKKKEKLAISSSFTAMTIFITAWLLMQHLIMECSAWHLEKRFNHDRNKYFWEIPSRNKIADITAQFAK